MLYINVQHVQLEKQIPETIYTVETTLHMNTFKQHTYVHVSDQYGTVGVCCKEPARCALHLLAELVRHACMSTMAHCLMFM